MKKDILKLTKYYAKNFSELSIDNYKNIKKIISKKIVFSDPFHKTLGKTKFLNIFKKMYVDFDNPKFIIDDISASEKSGYIKWTFLGITKKNKKIKIIGISEINFDDQGKVLKHLDHWDSFSQIFINFPIIGIFIKRFLKV